MFIAAPIGVGRVDGDLALQARDLAQRLADLVGGHGHEYGVGVGGIATIAADPRYPMARLLPTLGEATAHVSAADNGDVHAGSSHTDFRCYIPKTTTGPLL